MSAIVEPPSQETHDETLDDTVLLSDSDDEDDEGDHQSELSRLKQDFELRDKLFEDLASEYKPEHVQVAKKYEETMRRKMLEHYEAREKKLAAASPKPADEEVSWWETLISKEDFRGYATLLLYCIAHVSCWEIVTGVFYELTQNLNQAMAHLAVLVGSLALLRLTGGIYSWVDNETYARAKVTINRRLQKGCLDARLIKWFRKHNLLRHSLNTLSFYVCWIGAIYFQTYFLRFMDKREFLLKDLPSAKFGGGTDTLARKLLESSLFQETQLRRDLNDCLGDICTREDLESQDLLYLASELSIASYTQLMGDETAALVSTWSSIVFYIVAAVVSISILGYKLGHTFGKL